MLLMSFVQLVPDMTPPANKCRAAVFRFATHELFDGVITIHIVVNAVTMTLLRHPPEAGLDRFLATVNWYFLVVFFVEA